MFRKFNFFLFILLFSCIFCLTHSFADENGEPDEIFKFPVSEGPTDISVLPETQLVPEGVVGDPDFEKMRDLPINSQDYQLGQKVGQFRMSSRNEPGLFWSCTGFLVGPDLFMTNHHCFHDDVGQLPIEGAKIFMDYYEDKAVDPKYGGVTARVSAIVHANAKKDYALLRLDKPIGNTYGWLKLDTTLNPDDRSQRVKLISHPLGRSKEIVRRNSAVLALTPLSRARYPYIIAYLADSLGGSSGSPVFLRDGTGVVAIHHSGIFNRATGAAIVNLGSLMSQIVPEIKQYLPDPPVVPSSTPVVPSNTPPVPPNPPVPQYSDLVVERPRLVNSNLSPGASFRLSATVRNRGTAAATATTLRFYRSTDTTITTSDTQIGSADVVALNPGGTTEINITLKAPITLGTHHYGACVDAVNNENDNTNNCSSSVTLTVAEPESPDLVVETPLVSNDSLIPGDSFTLSATVRNRGTAAATATTLRFYQSTDTTLTQIGSADVAALNSGGTTEISITLKAPTTLGTYHYQACVDSVNNENNIDNNCSSSVTLTVAEPESPDLVVETPLVSNDSLLPGASFRLSATVGNRGDADATATTLRFYQSTDATITTSDTQIGTADVVALNPDGTAEIGITLKAPTTLGTHYYGACVDSVENENDNTNNCSPSVTLTVAEPESPDLVVETPRLINNSLIPGASFTLSATVRNRGTAAATATTLRFYQSTDTTITTSDTQIGTADVAALSPDGTAEIDITLKAPTTLGTHYYGACVDAVDNENASENNCSLSVTLTVAEPEYPDLVVETPRVSNNSLIPGDSFTLSATVRNRGDAVATATTLRFYQSTDATITASDTQIGTADTQIGSADVVALNPGGTAEINITLNAPTTLGTHHYGACVNAVDNENVSTNNCSSSVTLTVAEPEYPDLVVETPLVSNDSLLPGASFRLSATVRNRGAAAATATTLRFYQSTDTTITTSDTQIGSADVVALNPGGTTEISITLKAPTTLGTHYYGACVDSVENENDNTNNCSSSVTLTVAEPEYPDLVVEKPLVSNDYLFAGDSFTLSATVRNRGDAAATATTLRFYQSTDTTLTTSDTQIGTADVAALSPDGTAEINITLNAPTTLGTHHYGACVDSVENENDNDNNCSPSVTLTVAEPEYPDLVVETPLLINDSLLPGASFRLSATVRNRGTAAATATTLRFYQSTDTTLTASDIQIGTADMAALNPDGTAEINITLNAPITLGTHHYGACVDSVDNENNSDNNCSPSVTLTVSDTPPVYMYWTDSGTDKIQRAHLDGSNIKDIITTGLKTPTDIAVDINDGKVYWIDSGTDKIQRAHLDGSNIKDIVTTGLKTPTSIAVDLVNSKMYWTDSGTDKIQRANLDGSNIEDIVTTGLRIPTSIAIDLVNNKIYWTDSGTDKVQRANLDGSNIEDIITTGLRTPTSIAVDAEGGKIYWTDTGTDTIQRSDFDGSNIEYLITTGLRTPTSIAVDAEGGKIYWTDSDTDKIQRANLDGSNIEDIVTTGLRTSTGIALGIPQAVSPSLSGPAPGPLDVNDDGQVTAMDLVVVALLYGTRVPVGASLPADVNTDGVVNILDLTAVAQGIDAAEDSIDEVSFEAVEAALVAAIEQTADIEVIAEAPIGFGTPQHVPSVAYKNVADALADARHFAIHDVHAVLEGLLQLLTELDANPSETVLLPNYPNPFNPETWIPYRLATDTAVVLTIYDVRGVVVRELRLGYQSAGVYQSKHRAAYWDGRNDAGEKVASGVYFYTLTAGEFTATRKLLIAK